MNAHDPSEPPFDDGQTAVRATEIEPSWRFFDDAAEPGYQPPPAGTKSDNAYRLPTLAEALDLILEGGPDVQTIAKRVLVLGTIIRACHAPASAADLGRQIGCSREWARLLIDKTRLHLIEAQRRCE